jgi:glutamyl-tRNA synthetase
VNIVRAFGWEEPVWVHLSVFLKPSGKGKMSKRESAAAVKDGYSIFVGDLKDLGFIPEGVLNWCALMGWGVPEDDIMSLGQMVDRFNIDNLTASPAAVNFQRLDHFNATHIRLLTNEDLAARINPYFIREGYSVDASLLLKIVPLIRERLVTLDDCVSFGGFFFRENVMPVRGDLIAKGLDAVKSAEVARAAHDILSSLPEMTVEAAEPAMRAWVDASGLTAAQVFGILRVAITGQKVSPPLFESMHIIGKTTCLSRLQQAIDILIGS